MDSAGVQEILAELSKHNPIFTQWEHTDDGLLGRGYCEYIETKYALPFLVDGRKEGLDEDEMRNGLSDRLGSDMLLSDGSEDIPEAQALPNTQKRDFKKPRFSMRLRDMLLLTALSFFVFPPVGPIFMCALWIRYFNAQKS